MVRRDVTRMVQGILSASLGQISQWYSVLCSNRGRESEKGQTPLPTRVHLTRWRYVLGSQHHCAICLELPVNIPYCVGLTRKIFYFSISWRLKFMFFVLHTIPQVLIHAVGIFFFYFEYKFSQFVWHLIIDTSFKHRATQSLVIRKTYENSFPPL